MDLPEDLTGELARLTSRWGPERCASGAGGGEGDERQTGEAQADEARTAELGLSLQDPRLGRALELAREIESAPRHLGQHPGGSC